MSKRQLLTPASQWDKQTVLLEKPVDKVAFVWVNKGLRHVSCRRTCRSAPITRSSSAALLAASLALCSESTSRRFSSVISASRSSIA